MCLVNLRRSSLPSGVHTGNSIFTKYKFYTEFKTVPGILIQRAKLKELEGTLGIYLTHLYYTGKIKVQREMM